MDLIHEMRQIRRNKILLSQYSVLPFCCILYIICEYFARGFLKLIRNYSEPLRIRKQLRFLNSYMNPLYIFVKIRI